MNGLIALGLDFALIFAVYGMKEVALTKNQVATVGRVVARKGLTGDKGRDASAIRQARASVIESMGRKMGATQPHTQSKRPSPRRHGSVKDCVNH